MDLALACVALHGIACVVTIAFAIAKRRSQERHDALVLAIVWCASFVGNWLHDATLAALPPPSPTPLSTFHDRALLAANGALYFAGPLGFATWIRWTFVRARPLPIFVAWVLAFGIPTALYPLIRGASWFLYASIVHIVAFIAEVTAIWQWAKRSERPRPWHGAGLFASWVTTMPSIAFLVSPGSEESYGNWLLRAAISLHLWVIALIGGATWKS